MKGYLFRVWDRENSIMVTRKNVRRVIDKHSGDEEGYSCMEWYRAYYIMGIFDYFDYIAGDDRFDVEMCVGIPDSKGNNVFENDIIKCDNPEWGYGGAYDKENHDYITVIVPSIVDMLSDTDVVFLIKSGEVIGNLHENGDLL